MNLRRDCNWVYRHTDCRFVETGETLKQQTLKYKRAMLESSNNEPLENYKLAEQVSFIAGIKANS